LPPLHEPTLNGDSVFRNYLGKLLRISAGDGFVIGVFKPQCSKFLGPGKGAFDGGIFGDKASPLNVKVSPKEPTRE